MRGQQIISKISKFGNFTIRKGIADNDKNGSGTAQNSNKIGVDQPGTDGNSRAPLGQISLNAQPTAAATSNNNNKSKETTKEAPTDEPVLLPTTKKLLHISDAENEVDDNRPQQQKQGQKKLSKKGQLEAIDVAVGGQSSEDKVSTIGPAATNRHSDEAFVIYADEEEQENEQHQAKDDHGAVFVVGGQTGENDDDDDEGKEWEDAGGWERTTGTDQDYAVLSMRLSLGKENIPPFEKHEILLNFSTSTDDDTPLKDSNKSTSAVAEQKTTTKTTSTSITTKTIKESKKLWGKTTTASTESGVGAGDTSVEWHQGEGESSELGSSAEHNNCPSEYMTALTHHSVKSFVDERGDGSAKRHRRQFKNPMYCAYDADIYRWHLHRERAGRSRNYMPLQSDITEPMRAVLIDWCVDVVTEFELCPATFFLTVSVTDRTLSRVDCPRDKLQLLGAAALLTASKMHEIFPPTIKDIVHATDDCYTEAQVQRMEKIVLKATEFALGFPLVDSFAEFFDYYAPTPLGDVQRHMMWYLLELSTLNFTALHRHLPSRLAAAAFLIASCLPPTKPLDERAAHKKAPAMQKQMGRQMTKQRGVDDKNDEQKQQPQQAVNLESTDPFQQWEVMEQKTQIMRKELIEPVKTLLKLHRQAATTSSLSNAKVKAVRKKFSDARHNRVARMEFPSAIAASQLLCD